MDITNKEVNMTFRVNESMFRKVTHYALKQRMKKSEFIRRLIEKQISELEKETRR